jgi:hypothetical protein
MDMHSDLATPCGFRRVPDKLGPLLTGSGNEALAGHLPVTCGSLAGHLPIVIDDHPKVLKVLDEVL